ncbi:uncharacterized protein LOC110815164 [Carica papaya]|uniref:uncharacterized protein LOC110815164 n=1 Tax=Carica papaya TaxID=3649 RepID=UPI000B8CAF4A|nr:uncharacterized protein LOC110815164 [Carica papaya]
MASPRNLLAYSAKILFFFLIFSSSSLHATLDLIPLGSQLTKIKERACHATDSYRFCMKRLNRNPETSSASTVLSLEKAILQMGEAKAVKIQNSINEMHEDPTLVAVKQALDVCSASYQSIVETFEKVAELELEEDLLSANYDIMVLFDEIGYCEDALAKATARLPSMAIANRAMKHFISMAAAATNGLQ